MKLKTFLLVLVVAFVALGCYARDTYSTDVKILPKAAQVLLNTHFSKLQVNHIKIDHHTFGGNDYDVVLSDGTEVDFDNNGNLEEIDCGRNGKVPDALVMAPIKNYISRVYPKQRIIKYEVKRNGYEVELQNGIDLIFNKAGAFQRVDD